MRWLITGSHGFVGQNFIRRLLEKDDHEILAVDNLSVGKPLDKWMFRPRYGERLTERLIDCRELFRSKAIRPEQFDVVLHCAAIVGGKMNMVNDPLAVAINLSIDSEMFNWVVRGKAPLPRVIYFSSSAVYPLELQEKDCHLPLSEAAVSFAGPNFGKPESTYGFAKLAGEYLAEFARGQYGLDVKIFRPFGGYGANQDFNYPFPSIVRRVLNKENPVVVWGSGGQERDFIYIDDIIDVVLDTLYLGDFGPLNLGTGCATSFVTLAKMACEILGADVDVVADTSKPEGVFSRVADVSRLRQFRKNGFTPLKDGIMRVAKAMGA